ncbi:MAG: C45 family peptidase [Pseudomonadota bacterium]
MDTANMPVVEIKGTARQRGQAHGEALRPSITETVARWRESIAADYDPDVDGFIDAFLNANRFPAALERWTPGLMDEIEGIAEGAGQAEREILAIQFGDEQWWFDQERKADVEAKAITAQGKGCTAFGEAGDATLVGQTMDIESWSEGLQALLHVREEDGSETFIFTFAGYLGLLGMNSHGVGICCNALLQLDHSDDGLPVAAVVRGVLARRDVDEAAAFVRQIKHASGQNYVIGSSGKVVSLECSGSSVAAYTPDDGGARLWHTNHPLSNDDTGHFQDRLARSNRDPEGLDDNTVTRFATMAQRFGELGRPASLDDVKAALASEDDGRFPIARRLDPDNRDATSYTAGTAVYQLDEPPALHLAAGPASITPFRTFRFASATQSAA